MTKKITHNYDEAEYDSFCDIFEKEFQHSKEEGVFEVLKVLELDEEHSDYDLVQAINYFKKNDGLINKDAPVGFLSEHEKIIINKNGSFRPELYCMLLSKKFAESIENKSAFIQHSFKYSFDNQ